MSLIKTWTNGQITIDLHPDIYDRVLSKYESFGLFIERLKDFNNDLAKNLEIRADVISPEVDIPFSSRKVRSLCMMLLLHTIVASA